MSEEILYCDECPFITNSSRKLARHAANLHSSWKYHCPLCPFESSYVAQLFRHKKEVHNIGHEADLDSIELPDEQPNGEPVTLTMESPKPRRTSRDSTQQQQNLQENLQQDSTNGELLLQHQNDAGLMPCRIQRRYHCAKCNLTTRNPRDYLYHLRDIHGEKLKVYECEHCLYASRHQQKLQRHFSYVHSSKQKKTVSTRMSAAAASSAAAVKQSARKSMKQSKSPSYENIRVTKRGKQQQPTFYLDDNDDDDNDDNIDDDNDYKNYNLDEEDYVEISNAIDTLEEPLDEEILEIIDGEVDEGMNMFDCHEDGDNADGNPYNNDEQHLVERKCSMCHFKSRSLLRVQQHEKLVHGKPIKFACSRCGFSCDSSLQFSQHVLSHNGENNVIGDSDNVVECEQSLKVGDSEEVFSDRISVINTSSDLDSRENLTEASSVASATSVASVAEAEIAGSGSTVTGYRNMNRQRYKCSYCPQIFFTKPVMKRHEARHKLGHGLNGFSNTNNINPVENGGENNNVVVPEEGNVNKEDFYYTDVKNKTLKCRLCTYEAKWLSEMLKHIRIHTLEKPFGCPYCKFRSRWKGDMTRHVSKYHTDKKQIGNNNDMSESSVEPEQETNSPLKEGSTSSKDDLSYPRESSTSTKEGLSSQTKAAKVSPRNATSRHSYSTRTSTGNPPKKLRESEIVDGVNEDDTVTELPSHSAVITQQPNVPMGDARALRRQYQCPHCEFSATTASRFHVHIVAHLDQRPFMCSECGYRSNWQWDITKHIKLKATRGESHQNATLVTLDEEGSPNMYQQYDMYIVYSGDESVTDDSQNLSDSSLNVLPTNKNEDDEKQQQQQQPQIQQQQVQQQQQQQQMVSTLRLSNMWNCKSCDYKTQYRRLILYHTQQHTDRPFYCGECGQSSMWKKVVERHCRLHHNNVVRIVENRGARFKQVKQENPDEEPEDDMNDCEGFTREVVTALVQNSSNSTTTSVTATPPQPIADSSDNPTNSSSIVVAAAAKPTATTTTPATLGSVKIHICEFCPFKTRKIQDLTKHARLHKPQPGAIFKCMFCPFYTSLRRSLLQHMKLHVSRPQEYISNALENSPNKNKAPTTTGSASGQKGQNISAMLDDADSASTLETKEINLTFDTTAPATDDSTANDADVSAAAGGSDVQGGDGGSDASASFGGAAATAKRYSCQNCPYTSNSKTQYLYHKQFHRSNKNCPFKCSKCSYSVTRSHLLMQHERLHWNNGSHVLPKKVVGMPVATSTPRLSPPQSNTSTNMANTSPSMSNTLEDMSDVSANMSNFSVSASNTSANTTSTLASLLTQRPKVTSSPDQQSLIPSASRGILTSILPRPMSMKSKGIPLVWVSSEGLNKVKMFKCRYCPHVNRRRVNIQEHEKMHRKRRSGAAKFTCTDCTYVCNNQGVLSNHMKVHRQDNGLTVEEIDDDDEYDQMDADETSSMSPPPLMMSSPITSSPMKTTMESTMASPITTMTSTMTSTMTIGSMSIIPVMSPSSSAPPQLESPLSSSSSQQPAVFRPKLSKMLFHCGLCPERFTREGDRTVHLKFHGANLPWACTHCTYGANHRSQLYRHMKVHSPNYRGRSSETDLVTGEATGPPGIAADEHRVSTAGEKQAAGTGGSLTGGNFGSGSRKQVIGRVLYGTSEADKKHGCHVCPAKFLKPSGLAYHISLHGGKGQFRCPHCDYTVTNIGNLCRHVKVHELSSTTGAMSKGSKKPPKVKMIKMTMTSTTTSSSTVPSSMMMSPSSASSQFPGLMSPQPKNQSPVKVKRKLACDKCPALFAKLSRFNLHVSLHGRVQKYSCNKCDYSVKNLANLTKHKKVHEPGYGQQPVLNGQFPGQQQQQQQHYVVAKPLTVKNQVASCFAPPHLPVAEQQMMMIMQHQQQMAKQLQQGGDDVKRYFFCDSCPYQHQRKDAVLSHLKRHNDKPQSNGVVCKFCDYGTTVPSFLREHTKLHFQRPRVRVEAYAKYEQVEIVSTVIAGGAVGRSGRAIGDSGVIFKDRGDVVADEMERFVYPRIADSSVATESVDAEYKMGVNMDIDGIQDRIEVVNDGIEDVIQVEIEEGDDEDVIMIDDENNRNSEDVGKKSEDVSKKNENAGEKSEDAGKKNEEDTKMIEEDIKKDSNPKITQEISSPSPPALSPQPGKLSLSSEGERKNLKSGPRDDNGDIDDNNVDGDIDETDIDDDNDINDSKHIAEREFQMKKIPVEEGISEIVQPADNQQQPEVNGEDVEEVKLREAEGKSEEVEVVEVTKEVMEEVTVEMVDAGGQVEAAMTAVVDSVVTTTTSLADSCPPTPTSDDVSMSQSLAADLDDECDDGIDVSDGGCGDNIDDVQDDATSSHDLELELECDDIDVDVSATTTTVVSNEKIMDS